MVCPCLFSLSHDFQAFTMNHREQLLDFVGRSPRQKPSSSCSWSSLRQVRSQLPSVTKNIRLNRLNRLNRMNRLIYWLAIRESNLRKAMELNASNIIQLDPLGVVWWLCCSGMRQPVRRMMGLFRGVFFFLQSILPSQVFFISITALILSTLHEKEYQLAAASLELEEKAAPRGAPFGGGGCWLWQDEFHF